MRKPQKPRIAKSADPYFIFQAGTRFGLADAYLRSKQNKQAVVMASPAMVISAFTCELFLKCLLTLDKCSFRTTHRLEILFRSLHPKRKRRIVELWDAEARPKLITWCKELGYPSDLPNAVVKCGAAFEVMRYGYEEPEKQLYYLAELPWILYRVILEIKPEWDRDVQPTFHPL